ncbi:hypothetical protein Halha_1473 [Halobacteroides halobius DSM 5150]|uniref:Deacetylase PdaC domain-containing protein n=1 Tax=Halobacteroides halobius (strain ATCC 35273 / DSM 5150 / MD-1) TaxID=748449 RepID=L0K821_HALHC|nr:hypothetical protein [Halobacteroides halobius]AGB41417.1 hypothetical protein Halha_1473 [Halobacteroides halobius DSM 5150]
MKNKKAIILILVLFLLISSTVVFSFDSSNINLNQNKFKGKKLGIIIKMDDKFNYENLEKSYLNTNKYMLNKEELKKTFKFIGNHFKKHTNMEILNLSNENELITSQNYDYNVIQTKYKIDYLCIINLSNLYFNHFNEIMIDENYGSFIKISCFDFLTIKLSSSRYQESIFNFDLYLGSTKNITSKTKYLYSVLISYQLFDLSKEKLIYSEEEKGIYKTNLNYDKIGLIKKAIVNSLEGTTILKDNFNIEFFQY